MARERVKRIQNLDKFFKKFDKNAQEIKQNLAAIDAAFNDLMKAEEKKASPEVKASNMPAHNSSSI